MIEIIIPALNEADIIESSTKRLHSFLDKSFSSFVIHVVDNGSTDDTVHKAEVVAKQLEAVQVSSLEKRGKGRAIRHGWDASDADILGFIDADLSPSLRAIPPMVTEASESKLCVSSRHLPESSYTWTVKRRIITKSYNELVRLITGSGVSDHQCGLKFIDRSSWTRISPVMQSTEWFFDTELILHAQRLSIPVCEQSLDWADKPGSSVRVLDVSLNMLSGLYGFWREHGFPKRH